MSYQSSEMKMKRVTFKKSKENQNIKALLIHLYSQVVGKNYKTSKQIEQALASLAKYPLPISSGEECFILQGFNKTLCKFIDRKLTHNITASTAASDVSILVLPELKSSKSMRIQTTDQSISLPKTTCKSGKIPPETYDFFVKKKSDVVLFALSNQKKQFPERPTLNIKELILRVQNLLVNETIADWSFLKNSIEKKKYVKIELNDGIEVYSITDLGERFVQAIYNKSTPKKRVNHTTLKERMENRDYDYRIFLYDKYPELEPSWLVSGLNTVQNQTHMFIDMPPGSYNIIMLIDKNEPQILSQKCNKLICESKTLKVGDVMWVARSKTNSQELVLPYILERKRMDDFAGSIKDGRFHEQKFRLRKCGLKNVIYLIEDHLGNQHCGLSMATLNQARVNTRVQEGFLVHHTRSTIDTKLFLSRMTLKLASELEGVRLRGSNVDSGGKDLMTFEYFNSTASKTKPLTIKNLFIKMLLQLKGLSVEKALAITSVYDSPAALMEAYDRCEPRDAELLLANLKFNAMTTRVSPAISKVIYKLFNG